MAVSLIVVGLIVGLGGDIVVNARAGGGYFTSGEVGLTNAMHTLLVVCLPPLFMAAVGFAQTVGLQTDDPVWMDLNRSVWRNLGLEVRHVLVTHELLPRLPVVLIGLLPAVATLTLPPLTGPERGAVGSCLLLGVVGEVMRMAAAARRMRTLTRPARPGWRAGLNAVGVLGLGVVAGLCLQVLQALFHRGAAEQTPELVLWSQRWVEALPVTFPVLLCILLAGGFRLRGHLRPGVGFGTNCPLGSSPVNAPNRIPGGLWPVVGHRAVLEAWASPQVLFTGASMLALLVWAPFALWSTATLDVVTLLTLSALLAYALLRLVPHGISASLVRLRHHVELGASPTRHAVTLVATLALAHLPLAALAVLVLVRAGSTWPTATGLTALTFAATVLSDAFFATPGQGGLTERLYLLIAVGQVAVFGVIGCSYGLHPAFGVTVTGCAVIATAWLVQRKQCLWRPRAKLASAAH